MGAEIDIEGGRWLDHLVRRDQLDAARRSVLRALIVNVLLGSSCLAVAIWAGHAKVGGIWFAASSLVNYVRIHLCRNAAADLAKEPSVSPEASAAIERRLAQFGHAALLSGLTWACLPFLSAGYTTAQTSFHLIVTCGITAGAVAHSASIARIPISFIGPTLLSAAACLALIGGFNQLCLAATILLYLAVLVQTCLESEANFRLTSGLKNEAKILAEEMADRVIRDALTGLLNRDGFAELAESAHPSSCLMLLDLDNFRSINDVYGHKFGDRVLVEVGRRLRVVMPADALIGRLGGDEFALIFGTGDGGGHSSILAEQIMTAIGAPFGRFDAGRLGVSIGIHLGEGESLTERLARAGEALAAAKCAGRNRHRIFDNILRDRLDMRRDAERDLPQALAEGAVDVWFQPIFRVRDHSLAGLEALVRWRHPHHGWVSPPDLIAAAAETGLTEALLRTILEGVCTMMIGLRERGAESVRVAMNVSPLELTQVAVDQIVLERLAADGLAPSSLEIELTEETALDIAAVDAKLVALSRAGISIAVDDFGVGYSSLARLRQLRINRVKIDRSLVTGLSEAGDKRGLVEAVIGLGRTLAVEVVAEGVETSSDLVTLAELGCPFAQGYHLGRPMPAEVALRTLLVAPISEVA